MNLLLFTTLIGMLEEPRYALNTDVMKSRDSVVDPRRLFVLRASSADALTPGALFVNYPERYVTPRDENFSLRSATRHAEEEIRHRSGRFGYSEYLLLRGFVGQIRGEWKLRIDGGPLLDLRGDFEPVVDERTQVWAPGQFQAESTFSGTEFEFSCDVLEPVDKARVIPIYAGLSLAESFIRSRAIEYLMQHVEWPLEMNIEVQDYVVDALRVMHAPTTHEDVQWGEDTQRRKRVRKDIEAVAPEGWNPGPSTTVRDLLEMVNSPEFQASIHQAFNRNEDDEDVLIEKPVLPPPRLIKTARAAEEYAAQVMQALRFTRVHVTPVGPDGGVDVMADQGIAQVKMEGIATGRPAIQQLHGVASRMGVVALFFSLAGYTEQALAWAESVDMVCFEFEFDGSIVARTETAELLLECGLPS